MNSFKTTHYTLIILSFIMLFFFCTDYPNPFENAKPNILDNGEIKTFGTIACDSSFGMYITHYGTDPITFKWYKNDSLIANATNDTLLFPSLAFADTGNYYCVTSNNWGSDTSLFSDIVLTPQYTIKYYSNNHTSGSVPVDTNSYKAGDSVIVSGNTGLLTKTGFTFSEWNTKKDGTGTSYQKDSSFTIGSKNILLYAKWETIPTYKITYNGNGNTSGSIPVDTNNYNAGSDVTTMSNSGLLAKHSHTFSGWNTKKDGTGTTYTTGSIFKIGSSDILLYAKWTINPTYKITYDGNGNSSGSVPVDTNNYEAGATATVKNNSGLLLKTGYTFAGWNTKTDGTGTSYASGSDFTIGLTNATLYAKWTTNPTYKVTYNGNGNVSGSVPVDVNNYEAGATTTVKNNSGLLVKTGNTFSGWNTKSDGTGVSYATGSSLIIDSVNVTLHAKWTTNPTYKVAYNSNGSTSGSIPVDDNNYESGATVLVMNNSGLLVKKGFTFSGWNTMGDGTGTTYSTGNNFNIGSADVLLYTKWTSNPTYKVSYNGNGNASGVVPVDNNNYEAGSSVTVKNNSGLLAKIGYTFLGWNTKNDGTGTTYASGKNFAIGFVNIILYAKWTINQYTISFDSQSGSTVSEQNVNYGELTIKPVDPTRTGYTFGGWYKEAGCINIWLFTSETVTENVKLFAKWTTNQHTISFNSQGGTAVVMQIVNYGGFATQPTSPTRAGYTFGGWYKEIGCTNSWLFTSETVTVDVTLYAKWTIIQYTVAFNSQGGTAVVAQIVNYDGLLTQPTSPTRTGYTFGGWYKETECTNSWLFTNETVTVDATLYAKWTIIQYTVAFNSQGGTAVVAQIVNYDGLLTQPTSPTLTSYVFDGWYTDSTCQTFWDFAINQITSDQILYAKWVVKDIDGNIYTTVTIGEQVWMVENLRTTKYNDGNTIQKVINDSVWANLNNPAYCFNNNVDSNKIKYGTLYNWYVIGTGKLQITGWHVPTKDEWVIMEEYLISNDYNWDGSIEGNKVAKAMASKTEDWIEGLSDGHVGNDVSKNNKSNFSALPGGHRSSGGVFGDIGKTSYWWTSTEKSSSDAHTSYISYDSEKLGHASTRWRKRYGFFVRLIRN